MEIRALAIPDCFLIVPNKIADSRGHFYESLKADRLAEATGRPFSVAQTNFSVSRRGVLRGVHGVTLPPGQAKVVTCHRGALLDMLVDLRVGSPAYGQHVRNELDAADGASIFIPEGVGHAFLALADDSCIGYLNSTAHVPGTQLDINPLDPELGLDWGTGTPQLSDKDRTAPGLSEAKERGMLPGYAQCRQWYADLAAAG